MIEARQTALACLASGAPRRKWDELIAAQGADLDAFRAKLQQDHAAPVVLECISETDGFLHQCDARVIGEIVRDLGGGRMTKASVIQPDVGVDALAKPGRKSGAARCWPESTPSRPSKPRPRARASRPPSPFPRAHCQCHR